MKGQTRLVHWAKVREGLDRTVDKLTDNDLDYRPFEGSWTVRALLLHIAQEEHGEFAYSVTHELDQFPPEYSHAEYPTLASIRDLLHSVHRPTVDYLEPLTESAWERVIVTPWGASHPLYAMIDHMVEHEVHHRGELSLILGMLGRKGLDA